MEKEKKKEREDSELISAVHDTETGTTWEHDQFVL